MEKLTWRQAFDKITEAYIRGEIEPQDTYFCFCGNLCNNSKAWHKDTYGREHNDYMGYTGQDFVKMEWALLTPIQNAGFNYRRRFVEESRREEYEDLLFLGMSAALDVLKEIHRSRGENVEDFEFVKRPVLAL